MARLTLYWRALAVRLFQDSEMPGHRRQLPRALRTRKARLRKWAIAVAAILVVVAGGCAGLWWRLGTSPISVDIVTPWLETSLEQRLGGDYDIDIGGTQLERDESGRTAVRIRDIVLSDADGTVVASAPKAEVGIDSASLLLGQVRPERLSLIGAEMSVRIERDGSITVFAGADNKPIATAPAPPAPAGEAGAPNAPAAARTPAEAFAGIIGWLESLDALGLDGRDLAEIGLRDGTVIVDDRRNDKRSVFKRINLTLTRPQEGGVAFSVNSTGENGPWSITATVAPRGDGRRAFEAVLRDISPRDVLLALRLDDGRHDATSRISAILRAELAADGTLASAEGRLVAGPGQVVDTTEPDSAIRVDEARLELRWDKSKRQLNLPIEIASGANRIGVLAQVQAPAEPDAPWLLTVPRGMIILGGGENREAPLVLDRINIKAKLDPSRGRFEIEQGDIAGVAAGVALSGAYDFGQPDARLQFGLAGTRMNTTALKRMWPVFVAPPVRDWVIDHVKGGTVERVIIATNAAVSTLKKDGPPIPDEGLSIDVIATGAVVQPIDTLPAIREADLNVRVTGRTATIDVDHGVVELPSGRKLTITAGTFEVPDTFVKPPPAQAKFRIDGPVDAAAELTSMEPLSAATGPLIDPGTAKGQISAQVTLGLPLLKQLADASVDYTVDAELTNFSADKLVRGLRAEAASIKLLANPQGLQLKGDAKIGNTMVNVDYRRPHGNRETEFKAQATLDDGARSRLGFDFGPALNGPIPVKLTGRVSAGPNPETRIGVEADMTQARIKDLLPGWEKTPGRALKANFTMVERSQSMRLEDIAVDGAGATLRGAIELDGDGDVVSANFPTFALSDGDKASLKVERGGERALKVTVRGDVFDGRGFIKSSMSGSSDAKKKKERDVDLDVKLGAVAGHHGEVVRGLELRLSRRNGQIRSFALNAKLGRDATMLGDMRSRPGSQRQVVYVETGDAGALFRLTDIYPRIFGGQMWVALDPSTSEATGSDGILSLRDFVIRGEAALDRVVASNVSVDQNGRPVGPNGGVGFSRMRVDFTRSPGRITVRDGVVFGPAIGATVEGHVDFARDDVHLRGTFVPAYALNNIFSRLPVLGFFLGGGQNEGLLGVTYEVVGAPNAPVLRVNPMSAVAPGFLRKFFEFRGANENAAPPGEAGR